MDCVPGTIASTFINLDTFSPHKTYKIDSIIVIVSTCDDAKDRLVG